MRAWAQSRAAQHHRPRASPDEAKRRAIGLGDREATALFGRDDQHRAVVRVGEQAVGNLQAPQKPGAIAGLDVEPERAVSPQLLQHQGRKVGESGVARVGRVSHRHRRPRSHHDRVDLPHQRGVLFTQARDGGGVMLAVFVRTAPAPRSMRVSRPARPAEPSLNRQRGGTRRCAT